MTSRAMTEDEHARLGGCLVTWKLLGYERTRHEWLDDLYQMYANRRYHTRSPVLTIEQIEQWVMIDKIHERRHEL